MAESHLVRIASQWVVEASPYNSHHLLQSLVWLDRIAPESSEAVRLATLTHDMERAFPGPDSPVATSMHDEDYYRAHSERSRRIVGMWLRDHSAPEALVKEVEDLILVHEFGGWPEADLVQAADSLSFLETNIELFIGMVDAGKWSIDDVQQKIDWTYERIQVPHAKELARPLLADAKAKLARLRV